MDSRIAAPANTGVPPCSVVHPPRCMRAIGLVAMFHVEPIRVGRDGRLPANFGQWIPLIDLIDGHFAVIRSYNWTILAAAIVQRTSNGAYGGGWFFL